MFREMLYSTSLTNIETTITFIANVDLYNNIANRFGDNFEISDSRVHVAQRDICKRERF